MLSQSGPRARGRYRRKDNDHAGTPESGCASSGQCAAFEFVLIRRDADAALRSLPTPPHFTSHLAVLRTPRRHPPFVWNCLADSHHAIFDAKKPTRRGETRKQTMPAES